MTGRHEQLDPIEDALLELKGAERAGVFDRTRLDAETLVRVDAVPGQLARRIVGARWLSAAAVIALAVGVWGVVFKSPPLSTSNPNDLVHDVASPVDEFDLCDGSILRCLSGPSDIVVASGCRPHDYDADGDVDLADFRSYQLTCRGLGPRTR